MNLSEAFEIKYLDLFRKKELPFVQWLRYLNRISDRVERRKKMRAEKRQNTILTLKNKQNEQS